MVLAETRWLLCALREQIAGKIHPAPMNDPKYYRRRKRPVFDEGKMTLIV
jgi:hypothetical protein